MVLEEALEAVAKQVIPDKTHKILHVNCRKAWIEAVMQVLETERVKPTYENVSKLAKGWESLLYIKYSSLN